MNYAMDYNDIIQLLIGIYFIGFSFIMNTKNIRSSIVFKVMPFISGTYLFIHSLL